MAGNLLYLVKKHVLGAKTAEVGKKSNQDRISSHNVVTVGGAATKRKVFLMGDFLFSQPSYLSGVSRTLDLWGQFDDYNTSPNGDIADARAIFADWLMVGEELQVAADSHRPARPFDNVPRQNEHEDAQLEGHLV
jgi:hypothetical protein